MAYTELYRPRFHFTPPQMWMNDPNGFYFDGKNYHLYYQHNPHDKVWGPMHWGYARSTDMLHWEHRGIVMVPDKLGTIFSGCAISVPAGKTELLPEGGTAYFFTHDGEVECQSLATSTDGGQTLVKYPGNPIIPNDGLKDFRDPKVFWYEPMGAWCMIVAGGPVRFYHSYDLVHWTLTQQLKINTECPDLIPLEYEGRTLWLLSCGGVNYYLGDFDGKTYTVLEGPIRVDHGDSFYAVQSCSGVEGRAVWIGWMNAASTAPTDPWRCSMSIPRELSLVKTADGPRLSQKPIAELDGLHGTRCVSTLIGTGSACLPVDSHMLDMELTFTAGETAPNAAVTLFAAENSRCRVSYDGEKVTVDRSEAAVTDYHKDFKHRFSFPLAWKGESVTLRIVADQSTLEVFGPDGCIITCEIYSGEGQHKPLSWELFSGEANLTVCEIPIL